MKKALALALLAGIALTAPAYAADASDVSSDVSAVQKDNAAMAKDNAQLAKDRADKAKDKATGNWSGQAVDSMAVGADHVVKGEKGAETSTDKKILNHDTNSATGN